jgi:hypothetical protein
MEFLRELDESAADYVALFNPEHSKWNKYKTVIRVYVRTIHQELKVEQIRPLLFAISRHFTPEEAVKAFRLCVNWSVRFLIAGGRGGFLDRHYGLRAQEIGTGKVKTASQMADVMREFLPNDTAFQEKFWKATVSQSYLARYYLKTLDAVMSGEVEPEWVANPETEVVNLEHIMPKEVGLEWTVEPEVAAARSFAQTSPVILTCLPLARLSVRFPLGSTRTRSFSRSKTRFHARRRLSSWS